MNRIPAAILVLALAAAAVAAATTNENGYEVTRSQTVVPVPHGKVGVKTIYRETRTGNTGETDGNSSNFTMTLGGFMNRCPAPEGSTPVKYVVPGDFEYSIIADDVNTDVIPTERKRYMKRVTTQIKAFVNDDLEITEGEIKGDFTADMDGVRTGPVAIQRRFQIREYGTPDWDAVMDAVRVTGDLAVAALMWNSSSTILDLKRALSEPNHCAELQFDPPSESRAVTPGEMVEVRVKYRTRDGQQPIPRGRWEAAVVQGGSVAEAEGQVRDDGTFVVRYVARSSSTPKEGDGMRVHAWSAAGIAQEHWKIRTGLKLAIEHRLQSRRDTPHALGGWALYDGTVRFEISLDPFPTLPGEYRGETAVVRQFSVGHITPRCTGQGSQTETWRVNATVDAAAGTMKLGLAMFSDGLSAYWICDGKRSEVTSRFRSALKLVETPLTMPSRSGSRQTFTPSGPLFQETLTVAIP